MYTVQEKINTEILKKLLKVAVEQKNPGNCVNIKDVVKTKKDFEDLIFLSCMRFVEILGPNNSWTRITDNGVIYLKLM